MLYRYNNVASYLEFVQIISREFISSAPGKKFIRDPASLVKSSYQISYSGIENLLNQQGVKL